MKLKYLICSFLLITCSMNVSSIVAQDNFELPVIKGSVLAAEQKSGYDEAAFFVPNEEDLEEMTERYKEGKLTRAVYLLEKGQSPLFALRNYQEAFSKLGEITEVYSCRSGNCLRKLTVDYVWAEDKGRRMPSIDESIDFRMLGSTNFQDEQQYWYAIIKSDKSTYNVSVAAVIRNDYGVGRYDNNDEGRVLIYVQVVEYSDFKSDFEYFEADEIQSSINESGHIALSGLFFDTGSDQLTAESSPALNEIAKAMEASPQLQLYVVGHTDNVGSAAANQDLSARRAKSVAASLVQNYGINSDRLVSVGVGLAAPVTSNKTEEGRALNRRVELVER